MKRRIGRAIAAIATGSLLILSGAEPAMATPAAPAATAPSAEARASADQIANALLEVVFGPEASHAMTVKMAKTMPPEWPATWTPLLADAAATQAHLDLARFARPVSDLLLARMTPGELKAGAAFFTSPGARLLMVRKLTGNADEPAGGQQVQIDQASAALRGSADGRSFAAKMQGVSAEMANVQGDALKFYMPAVFKRFGEAAEAERARTETAPSEHDRLGGEVACATLPIEPMAPVLKAKVVGGMDRMFANIQGASNWHDLMTQAVSDEIDARRSNLCIAIGGALTRQMTVEDERKALVFLDSSAGAAVRGAIADGAAGRRSRPFSPALSNRINRFSATPAGRKLVAGMAAANKESVTVGETFGIAIVPGVFRRFGEKVLATEAEATPAPTTAP